MGTPHLTVTPDHSELNSETSVEGYSLMLREMQQTLRARLPGVLTHVGSLYDGSGGGFTTVTVQGEFVDQVQQMFPEAHVSAMSETDYNITSEQERGAGRQAA